MADLRSERTILRQLCELIPPHLVSSLAKKHGIQSRAISPWSHCVALIYAQMTHALSLNDVCDALYHHKSLLYSIRGAKPPSRNGLAYANKTRDPAMAEELFYSVLEHLKKMDPSFAGRNNENFPHRFFRTIHAVDSSTLKLVANNMDWAKHRRRKAAAKLHLDLNLNNGLPAYVYIGKASEHDGVRARELCAHLKAGEIVVMDRAYIDFQHL